MVVQGNGSSQVWRTIVVFNCKDWKRSQKSSVRVFNVLAQIQPCSSHLQVWTFTAWATLVMSFSFCTLHLLHQQIEADGHVICWYLYMEPHSVISQVTLGLIPLLWWARTLYGFFRVFVRHFIPVVFKYHNKTNNWSINTLYILRCQMAAFWRLDYILCWQTICWFYGVFLVLMPQTPQPSWDVLVDAGSLWYKAVVFRATIKERPLLLLGVFRPSSGPPHCTVLPISNFHHRVSWW